VQSASFSGRSRGRRDGKPAVIGAEANERLIAVGPGSPAGELLRQYWHPLVPSEQLPVGGVRREVLLDEPVVVYRDDYGGVHAVAEACPHRGASLSYGIVEGEKIRCSYHGWRFGRHGECVERPFETATPTAACHLTAYHARDVAGLVFVSLARTADPPPFPMWDILARTDVRHRIDMQEDLDCNWLQVQENAADVTHTYYLHANELRRRGLGDDSGFAKTLTSFGFQPFSWGIVKSWTYRDDDGSELTGWGNMLVFPSMLRIETEMHWRVPLDRSRTRIVILAAEVGERGPAYVRQLPPRRDTAGRYTMTDFYSQDAMAWETPGAVYDRSREHLAASDVGIVMFREMFDAAIRAHEEGRPLVGQRRDGDADGDGDGEPIDLRRWMDGYLPMSAPPDPTPVERLPADVVFDERHRTYDVPTR
jgi:5,5'-dehydrodivanillate O-demethylase